MKIKKSNATFSSIVGIGQKVKAASIKSGSEYLELNRGVNMVTGIDLSGIWGYINPNSTDFQVYAANRGTDALRRAIISEYFPTKDLTRIDNISITPGGMPALDLVLQLLDVKTFHFPTFYWGSYSKMADIRKRDYLFYDNLQDLSLRTSELDCVFICDPNNPTGVKMDDALLWKAIKDIEATGATVIFDCPYRKLFYNDDFFDKISDLDGVIITESFSKWVGLSGLRLGFIWSKNTEFNTELNIRLLYEFNGVSAPPQLIIQHLLNSDSGKLAHSEFRVETTETIKKNIQWLNDSGLLAKEIYGEDLPIGIFAVINKSEDFLFERKIGAVGLDKFTQVDREKWSAFSRICVSVEHEKFVNFLKDLVK